MASIDQPLYTNNPDCPDGGYLLSPAAAVLMLGRYAYESDDEAAPAAPAARVRTLDALRRILSAARAGGFTQGDVLETMLARGKVTVKAKELAHAAIDAAGADAVVAIMQSLKP